MSIFELESCRLELVAGAWPFAVEKADAIARNWEQATAANPNLYNGGVFVVSRWRIEAGRLEAQMLKTTFAAYLYWRETGFGEQDYDEAFVTTVVRSRDGGMLVARAVDGTLNEGHFIPAGGLIDARDVTPEGLIDPAAAAARELAEETGLAAPLVRRRPGFLLARHAPYLALASLFDADVSNDELIAIVQSHLRAQAAPELLEPTILSRRADLDRLPLTVPTRLLGAHVLD